MFPLCSHLDSDGGSARSEAPFGAIGAKSTCLDRLSRSPTQRDDRLRALQREAIRIVGGTPTETAASRHLIDRRLLRPQLERIRPDMS
jgi:hypothetical protein